MILQSLAGLVTSWDLQPFFAPQAFDLLVIDFPALDMQACGNLAIPILAMLFGQAIWPVRTSFSSVFHLDA